MHTVFLSELTVLRMLQPFIYFYNPDWCWLKDKASWNLMKRYKVFCRRC